VLLYGGEGKPDSSTTSLRALTMLITIEDVASGNQRYEEERSGSKEITVRHTSASRTHTHTHTHTCISNSVTRKTLI
jgi:hypothetical protein